MNDWSWFSFGIGLLTAGLIWIAVELRDAPEIDDDEPHPIPDEELGR